MTSSTTGRRVARRMLAVISVLLALPMFLSSCARNKYVWERVARFRETGGLISIDATGQDNIWVAGLYGEIIGFDGTSWSRQANAGKFLYHIAVSDKENVWAIGKDSEKRSMVVYFFNGVSLERQLEVKAEKDEFQKAIFALDASNVWADMTGGRLYYYDGSSWRMQHQLPS